MSITEVTGPRPEAVQPSLFAEAIRRYPGAAANPEHTAALAATAERIERTGKIDAPVLLVRSGIDIQGGVLVDTPTLEHAANGFIIGYTALQRMQPLPERVDLRAIAGLGILQPHLLMGDEAIGDYVRTRYSEQRVAEQRGTIAWDDMSPISELYLYAALFDAHVRLSDFLPAADVAEMHERLLAELEHPPIKALVPTLRRALMGVSEISADELANEIARRQQPEASVVSFKTRARRALARVAFWHAA